MNQHESMKHQKGKSYRLPSLFLSETPRNTSLLRRKNSPRHFTNSDFERIRNLITYRLDNDHEWILHR